MSKFSDFIKSPEPEKPDGIIIDGSFACQVCNEYVDEARYYAEDRFLLWRCTNDHQSFVEEFML